MTEVVLTRSWGWGIAILGDPTEAAPDPENGQLVSIGEGAMLLIVRHAQDIERAEDDDYWQWATATVHLRSMGEDEFEADEHQRPVLCDVVLRTPSRTISVGDADEEIAINGLGLRTRVVVSAEDLHVDNLDYLWVDLVVEDVPVARASA